MLIYSLIASLDGYVADADGEWGWSRPDEEVHSFINDLERQLRTHLYGRRLYEVLRAWEDMDVTNQPSYIADFKEIWRGADKIVFSTTLAEVTTGRTQIERDFDPEMIQRLKEKTQHDILIGGPELAAQAIRARLGRRASPPSRAGRRRRRQEGSARRFAPRPRVVGRAPFRQRHRLSPLRHRGVTRTARAIPEPGRREQDQADSSEEGQP